MGAISVTRDAEQKAKENMKKYLQGLIDAVDNGTLIRARFESEPRLENSFSSDSIIVVSTTYYVSFELVGMPI